MELYDKLQPTCSRAYCLVHDHEVWWIKRTICNVARARSEAGAFLGSEASGASFSKNPRKRSVLEASIIYIYIYKFYIYCVYIQKNM
jgi:hypothetical protein